MKVDMSAVLIWTPWGAAADAAKDAAQNFFDSLLMAMYGMSVDILTGAFRLFNTQHTIADLMVNPAESGPFHDVMTLTTSLGTIIALLMAMLQIPRAVTRSEGGFGRLMVGLAEYAIVCAMGIWFLTESVKASGELADGILEAGGVTNGWLGVSDKVKSWSEVGDEAGAVLLGVVGMMLLLPAAVLYLIAYLVHQLVIPLGACLLTIMAAGRLSDFGRSWLPGVARVLGAAALGPPGSALLLVIGFAFMNVENGEDQTIRVFIGSVVLLISPLAPLGIHRMLAFVDPRTPSGSATRDYFERTLGGGSSGSRSGTRGQAGRSSLGAAEEVVDARFAAGLAMAATHVASGGRGGGRPHARAPQADHTAEPRALSGSAAADDPRAARGSGRPTALPPGNDQYGAGREPQSGSGGAGPGRAAGRPYARPVGPTTASPPAVRPPAVPPVADALSVSEARP
ncbi:hypothetical protein ABZS66_42270 [Dactylosporangium sp. NPDC005572]|uniref:hypothetical protein n=1 Tax=Dactylosporangium sp. NPDC005572 TaxID=3156889 RepID=UPI0033B204F5